MSDFANSESVVLKNVRLDYFDVFTAAEPQKEADKKNPKKWKFKAKAIFEKGSEAEAVAKKAMGQAAIALWGENAKNVVPTITANSKALRDGNGHLDKNGAIWPEYKDKLFISCSNVSKPRCVAQKKHNGKFVTISPDGRGFVEGRDVTNELGYPITVPYRGCYVNLKVQFTAGKAKTLTNGDVLPNQIFAKFEALQFLRDGEAFGAGPTSAEGFDDEAVPAGSGGGNLMDDDIPFAPLSSSYAI